MVAYLHQSAIICEVLRYAPMPGSERVPKSAALLAQQMNIDALEREAFVSDWINRSPVSTLVAPERNTLTLGNATVTLYRQERDRRFSIEGFENTLKNARKCFSKGKIRTRLLKIFKWKTKIWLRVRKIKSCAIVSCPRFVFELFYRSAKTTWGKWKISLPNYLKPSKRLSSNTNALAKNDLEPTSGNVESTRFDFSFNQYIDKKTCIETNFILYIF